MKKVKVFLVCFLLLASVGIVQATPVLITDGNDAALNGSTLIDFNAESLAAFNSKTFNSFVTFTAANSGNLFLETTYSGSYGATGVYLANRSTLGPFTIDFDQDVSAFGFSWGAADQGWTMDLYNNTNALLGSLNVSAQTDPYIGFIGGTDPLDAISYAVLTVNSNSADYFLLDDFEYVIASTGPGSPVPEPATMLLLGLGLLGLAGVNRRKK